MVVGSGVHREGGYGVICRQDGGGGYIRGMHKGARAQGTQPVSVQGPHRRVKVTRSPQGH